MKAIVIPNPYEIEIRDLPMPEVKEGEALLRVRCVGICGADVASYTGNQPFTTYPRIPGHEFSAEIVEIPDNDKGLKPGDIVTCNPYFNCGSCYSCERGFVNCCTDNQTMGVQRDGAFCEYIASVCSQNLGMKVTENLTIKLGGSEDFSYMVNRVQSHGGQGVFMRVCSPVTSGGHKRDYNFDESFLTKSVKAFCGMAYDLMK